MKISTDAPKFHAFEHHVVEQMRMFGGIGDFVEAFIEQSHQDGNREEKRTSFMRDRKKAAVSHTRWESIRNLPEVQCRKDEVCRMVTRKRKHGITKKEKYVTTRKDESDLRRQINLECVQLKRGNKRRKSQDLNKMEYLHYLGEGGEDDNEAEL